MKKIFLIIILAVFNILNAQDFSEKNYILTDFQTGKTFIKKDSLSAVKFLDSLSEYNYYFTKVVSVENVSDSVKITFDKGKNYNEAHVKINPSLADNLKKEQEFFTRNLDSLKKSINRSMVDKGFTFNRVKTRYLGMENGIPKVEISVIEGTKRKIDGFVVRGYEKVPKRFVKNIEKEHKGKIYDQKNLLAIQRSVQNHAFVTLDRPPQTLFTKDSTNIYLFMQKKKGNTFDGIIGFGNNESEKFTFNGSLNLNLRNTFNGFETISLYWQRNPDKGQTFNLQTDIPYLFKSNVGMNMQVNVFRQDSTFAGVKMLPALYYNLGSRQKIGLRETFETSTVMDSLYVQGKDYNKKGIGIWYEYTNPAENPLFLHLTKIRAESDLLAADYTKEHSGAKQTYVFLFAEHNLPLSGNHWLNLKGESALMNSDNTFTTNELMRFGGWNSMRGFNENSLYADFYYYGNAEYRYLIGERAFFDAFLQYGQLNNKTLEVKPKLYSFGIGFNFFLPVGLMTFQISNGKEFGNPVKFGDTKINWGILSRF
ncbi:MAG: hypothetical protein QM564_02755 [Bergeyella sp.]